MKKIILRPTLNLKIALFFSFLIVTRLSASQTQSLLLNRSLDPIWEHFGFQRLPKVDIKITWKQIDTSREEQNLLEVWGKQL